MKYAKKLNLQIPQIAYELRRTTRVIGRDGSEEMGEVYRRYVTRLETEKILQIFPAKIAESNVGLFISKIQPLHVHVHTEEECVINLYLQAAKAKTVFYEGDVVKLEQQNLRNDDKYFCADERSLNAVEEFEAASGDIWLLKTKQPHAVIADETPEDRWAIQIYLSATFDEIANCLCNQ